MVVFCPLASGSSGNATYIKTDRFSLLVDAGCSCEVLEERLHLLIKSDCKSPLDAILISHEHIDHISALEKISLNFFSASTSSGFLSG
ncbi:MBL fold metallo-hydrolase [Candidatus Similichlamydia epinepheli]|uniref:MBL fold metallo-hydrolase n=1 Tax=Candidatus Similichlamydia epinepheli TaxID=1903953 RepID=UPI000D3C1F0A